jgi:hypothetical protein
MDDQLEATATNTLGMTMSTCPVCRAIGPTKVLAGPGGVSFRKFCPTCGQSDAFVYADAEAYLAAHRYVKPAWRPLEFAGDSARPCPTGCGLCDRHKQHLCMPIVEITTRCDLACPVCIARAGGQDGVLIHSGEDRAILRADSHLECFGVPSPPRGGFQSVQIPGGVEFLEHNSLGGHRRDLAYAASRKKPHRA